MRRHWVFQEAEEETVRDLSRALDLPLLLARLLIHRGADSEEEARDFLCGELSGLAAPESMGDLAAAARLIREAVRRRRKILLVGDYDVDGLTSAAILYRAIRRAGGEVEVHIPHRLEDGYGLKAGIVQAAARDGVRLLVTVDCGTTSFKELRLAGSLGMETIVVDHHDLESGKRPPASAFLNPLEPGCSYPEKELSSAGVAFTLARGLAQTGGSAPQELWQELDLVALGTIADMTPLTGENRILARAGLHALRGTRKPGLRALLNRAGLEGEPLCPEDVSFRLAPPLNAIGRTGAAQDSFRLLVTEDGEEAEALAAAAFRENRARAALEREAYRRALSKVTREVNFSQDRVIVLHDEAWHPGVIGILATRLAQRFHRPAVVITLGDSICRGSARSIRCFPLTEALHSIREHLVEFGGHPGAAGLTLRPDRIGGFREALNRLAHERIPREALVPAVEVDGELPLSDLNEELIAGLEALAPFGTGNPRPVFVCRDAMLSPEGERGIFSPSGVRLQVQSAGGRRFEALHPRHLAGDGLNVRRVRGHVLLAYSPVRRGASPEGRIELRLHDLKLP